MEGPSRGSRGGRSGLFVRRILYGIGYGYGENGGGGSERGRAESQRDAGVGSRRELPGSPRRRREGLLVRFVVRRFQLQGRRSRVRDGLTDDGDLHAGDAAPGRDDAGL